MNYGYETTTSYGAQGGANGGGFMGGSQQGSQDGAGSKVIAVLLEMSAALMVLVDVWKRYSATGYD